MDITEDKRLLQWNSVCLSLSLSAAIDPWKSRGACQKCARFYIFQGFFIQILEKKKKKSSTVYHRVYIVAIREPMGRDDALELSKEERLFFQNCKKHNLNNLSGIKTMRKNDLFLFSPNNRSNPRPSSRSNIRQARVTIIRRARIVKLLQHLRSVRFYNPVITPPFRFNSA